MTITLPPREGRAAGPSPWSGYSKWMTHWGKGGKSPVASVYRGVLGFELTQRYGEQAAFLSAGGYHHHLGLNTWESLGGPPPPAGTTGLYHLAILYPTRAALADALRRVLVAGVPLDGASDHGVSEALYLRDPDGNGVELYWDRAPETWPRTPDGRLAMFTRRLDLQSLLGEAQPGPEMPRVPQPRTGPRDL